MGYMELRNRLVLMPWCAANRVETAERGCAVAALVTKELM